MALLYGSISFGLLSKFGYIVFWTVPICLYLQGGAKLPPGPLTYRANDGVTPAYKACFKTQLQAPGNLLAQPARVA